MHKRHPVFKKPENDNIKIWRYMDFTKFVSLLDRKALFFPRADRLGDKFEGSLSKKYYPPKSPKLEEFTKKVLPKDQIEIMKKENTAYFKALRRWTAVNCWHMNECESAAMWKLYLKSDEGIAVQSTYKKLSQSLANYREQDVHIGVVTYIDYEKEVIPHGNVCSPFFYKRKSFEYERELRAIIIKLPAEKNDLGMPIARKDFLDLETIITGLEVPVSLETLIEKVYVSPTADEWFEKLVKSVLTKYGPIRTVTKSSLADDPIF